MAESRGRTYTSHRCIHQSAAGPVIRTVLLTLLLLDLTACATRSSEPEAARPTSPLPQHFVLPSRVAVLPFRNETNDPDAASQVRRIFYNYFSSLNYRDIELYNVDKVVNDPDWTAISRGEEKLPWSELCRSLNVDGLVTGTVHKFGKIYALVYSENTVAVAVQFRNCRDGSYIWQDYREETIRDGDIPFSLTGLAATIFTSYLEQDEISTREVAAKVSQLMTAQMPNPPSVMAVPPKITLLLHNASGRLLVPGQILKVAMIGDPGLAAYWSISEGMPRLPLTETEPGIYLGQHEVKSSERILNTRLVGYLVSKNNAENRWVDILEPVTLGEPKVLPSIIEENLTLSPDNGPYLMSEILLVKQNARLNIQAGTTIWSDRAGLVVNGQLHADGTPDNQIVFRSHSDSLWKGITLNNPSTPSHLDHVEIKQAEIALNAYQARLSGDGLILQDNEWGLVAQGAWINLADSLIQHSQKVGLSCRDSTINLTGNTISDNLTGGAQFERSQVTAKNNAIFDNGEWDVKNLDADRTLQLGHNWWGTDKPTEAKVVGNILLEPILSSHPAAN